MSEVLIRQSSEVGDLVVDPFMGSGSVGVAAMGLERDFWGNDLCKEAVTTSTGRIMGAGGGGHMIVLAGQDNVDAVMESMTDLPVTAQRVKFDLEGLKVWQTD